jgi:hypothetical protein
MTTSNVVVGRGWPCWMSVVACLVALGATGAARADAAPSSSKPVGPGAVIEAFSDTGQALQFRIDSVDTDARDRDGDVRLYGVSVRNPRSRAWESYCAPDVEGRSLAIPVQGAWDARGDARPGTGLITFACTSGAIAKCIRFGYKPWKTYRGVSLRPYHAACMRMVRADYCGDGRPHTLDGTQIDMWDGLGIQQRDQQPGHPEVFEAAWGPAGAAYLNVPRWSDDVADVVKDCPAHFAGRTSADGKLTPAQLARRFPEALIYNARFVRSQDRRPGPDARRPVPARRAR